MLRGGGGCGGGARAMACCCCAASAEVEVVSIAMQLVEVGWKDRFALGIFWEKPMCKTAVAVDCLAKFTKAAGLPVIVDREVGLEPRLRPGDITLPR